MSANELIEEDANGQPATNNEEETTPSKENTGVELIELKGDDDDDEKDKSGDDDDSKEQDEEEEEEEDAIKAKQTIHEDSEDSKQFYKLDDFELEYNVKGLKDRFLVMIKSYSGFEDDIYTVPERELMDVLGTLAIDSYGVLLWILCMDQLETERMKIIWDILTFLAMRMPTEVGMALLKHYESQMARYSPADVSELGKALVHGSEFPLATCLVLSAFFSNAAKSDLTRKDQLRALSKDYAVRATRIIDEIENDYLAVIMLETPSFHDGNTPLEIALDNEIIDFLACNKVSRISNAMWMLPNLMDVESDLSSSWNSTDFGASDIHKALLENSEAFYFSSMGYLSVEIITYLLYLGVFTYLTHEGQPIHAEPRWIDYTFWVANFGFVLGELIEFAYDGARDYFGKWQNWLDTVISVNFILIIIIRSSFTILADEEQINLTEEQINGDVGYYHTVSVVYRVVWVLNIIILWLRCLHFMLLSRAVGPLITNIKNMLKDIVSFTKIYMLVLLGFVFGLYYLIGGPRENGNVLFEDVPRSLVSLVKTTLGQLEWECVRVFVQADDAVDAGCPCDYYDDDDCPMLVNAEESSVRADFATLLLLVFSILTLVVLFNLLTAMMATTYRLITDRADKEVLSRKVALGREYDGMSQVMPPPLNILVLTLFVVYSFVDLLLLLFARKFISESYGRLQWKCKNCNCLNPWDEDDEDAIQKAARKETEAADGNAVLNSNSNLSGGGGGGGDTPVSGGGGDTPIRRRMTQEEEGLMRTLSDIGALDDGADHAVHVCQLCGHGQTDTNVKRRFWRKPRASSDGDGRWTTFVKGFRELLDLQVKEEPKLNSQRTSLIHQKGVQSISEHHKDVLNKNDEDIMDERMETEMRIKHKDWICSYCRNRIPSGQLGEIETFTKRLFSFDIRVDEDDTETIQQINPLLCPICYRSVSVRSRRVFVMEEISYGVFLFILYPILRICLIPIYFFQAIYQCVGQENDDEEDNAAKKLATLTVQNDLKTLEQQKQLQEVEEMLPSDMATRSLLAPSHKIWKTLKYFKKKKDRIEIHPDAKMANEENLKAKEEIKKYKASFKKKKKRLRDDLTLLVDKYWNDRLNAADAKKENAKRRRSNLLEMEELEAELGNGVF